MFDPARPYRCSPQVAVRPEPFGALTYDYRTRRLTFLKSPALATVVRILADHPDVHSALRAAGIGEDEAPGVLHALARLADAGTVEPREAAVPAGRR